MGLGQIDLERAKQRPLYCMDTYSLHTIIAHPKDGYEAETYRAEALREWLYRFSKPYPYHPSYENEIHGGLP